jgi:hypothetical protein
MYHLSSIPLVSLTGNTCPPFQEGLPMASRHGAIMGWAERVEGKATYREASSAIGRDDRRHNRQPSEWCPVCEFWHGRDRFTGERVN